MKRHPTEGGGLLVLWELSCCFILGVNVAAFWSETAHWGPQCPQITPQAEHCFRYQMDVKQREDGGGRTCAWISSFSPLVRQ